MTFTDYAIDLGLIGLVVLQLRGRRLTVMSLLLPFALIAWAANSYLTTVPTTGDDLVLIGAGTLAGLTLGLLAGWFTRVRSDGKGNIISKATAWAAAFWVLGVGARLAFSEYATHGGGRSLVHFSASHDITTMAAWTAALIFMAFAEVLARTAIIATRGYALHRNGAGSMVRSGHRPAAATLAHSLSGQDGGR